MEGARGSGGMDGDDGRRCREAEGERSDGAVAWTAEVRCAGDDRAWGCVGDLDRAAGDDGGDGHIDGERPRSRCRSGWLLGDGRRRGRRGDEGDGEEFAGERGGVEAGDEDDDGDEGRLEDEGSRGVAAAAGADASGGLDEAVFEHGDSLLEQGTGLRAPGTAMDYIAERARLGMLRVRSG